MTQLTTSDFMKESFPKNNWYNSTIQVCYQTNFSSRNYCYITIKLQKYIKFDSILWNSDKQT